MDNVAYTQDIFILIFCQGAHKHCVHLTKDENKYFTLNRRYRLGGGVVADAIMDRIVHNAMTINSGTLNMREFLAAHPI